MAFAQGWLGLLLGTRLYYHFNSCEHEEQALFENRVDKLVREIGDRGKPITKPAEGVPPAPAPAAPARPLARAPAPAPAPVAAPTRRLPPLQSSSTPAAAAFPEQQSFTPSMQQLASVPTAPAVQTTDDVSLVRLLLEREERMRLEMEAKAAAEKDELRQEIQQMREHIMKPPAPPAGPAISKQQIAALQARIESLRTQELLTDDELYALEDLCADYLALGLVTLDMAHMNEVALKVIAMNRVSEGQAGDAAFARQARRKFV